MNRKLFIALIVIGILSVSAISYAHMWGGGWGWRQGMMGDGPDAYGCGEGGYDQKFLDETADLRKTIHGKMFDLREAWRKGEKAEALEKEVEELKDKLFEKAESAGIKGKHKYGRHDRSHSRGCGDGPGTGCGPCGG